MTGIQPLDFLKPEVKISNISHLIVLHPEADALIAEVGDASVQLTEHESLWLSSIAYKKNRGVSVPDILGDEPGVFEALDLCHAWRSICEKLSQASSSEIKPITFYADTLLLHGLRNASVRIHNTEQNALDTTIPVTDEVSSLEEEMPKTNTFERAGNLCSIADPETFFPEKGGSTREAKRICGMCAVKAECLNYALENEERFGIWGGKSERERRKLKRLAS